MLTMNLTLKVVQKDNANFSNLLKQMCQLQCRIRVDMKQGEINIFNMDDDSVEGIIDAISEVFNFETINIVPNSVTSTEAVVATTADTSSSVIEMRLNDLTNQIRQIMNNSKISPRILCQYIETTMSELKMRFESREKVAFKVGDIVACNYGTHLLQEVSGVNIHSLVCSVDDTGMAFVLPITKKIKQRDNSRYIPVVKDEHIKYFSSIYTGGTLLINRGKYVNPSRFTEVVGSATPYFLDEVLSLLPAVTTFSSGNIQNEVINNIDGLPFDLEAPMPSSENTFSSDDVVEEVVEISESTETEIASVEHSDISSEDLAPNTSSSAIVSTEKPKKVTVEKFLSRLLEKSLVVLGDARDFEDSVNIFMNVIGMFSLDDVSSQDKEIMKFSLISACHIKDITFNSVYSKLQENYMPSLSEKEFKTSITHTFKNWLNSFPSVLENYSKVSPMSLLKVFAVKVKYLNLL